MNDFDVLKMYDDGESVISISKHFGTYPNKIRRIIKRNGRQLRDKSEAQKFALNSGRAKHPTKGKERDDNTKIKISESLNNYWENISDEDRAKKVNRAKEAWNKMSEIERENLRRSAIAGLQKASKEGSVVEKFLYETHITSTAIHIRCARALH